ncbi:MAG: hydantoinase B/oxoprolinase family protein [Planctomycetaceae bacterium]|nr:hydantoinase B/oxoprolinase family protein [Planctomycetaceae bacterium]
MRESGPKQSLWKFWIDVGGTFTDCIGISPQGHWSRVKVLSSSRLRCRLIRDQAPGLWRVETSTPLADKVLNNFTCSFLQPDGSTRASGTVMAYSAASESVQLKDLVPTGDASHSNPWPVLPDEITAEFSSNQLAPLLAIRLVLGIGAEEALPPIELRLGTTRGTNALLTRSGARTAFVTTRGFGDSLEIGDQQRPDLFALTVRKEKQLYATAIEVEARMSADGAIIEPLEVESVRHQLESLKQQGIESLAICLLHGYQNPQHELELAELARGFKFRNVSLSHVCSPLIRFVPRASTTVLDAYLNPILRDYVAEIETALGSHGRLLMMTSSGGLVPASQFSGKDSVLSGPAGGVVGFTTVAQQAGHQRAIGFDMGGTSTDVARLDGSVALQSETRKAGVVLQTPTLAIETVAAGGGSICSFDGQRLLVGPQSAGADPGPACYGRGGPLTITDMNVWLGRIRPELFPVPLQRSAIADSLSLMASDILKATGKDYSAKELALAFIQIANSHIASAIAAVSTRQGMDPREYPMVAFGGAAAQHVCGVAQQLGIETVLVHPDAALLSAYGIGHSDVRRIAQKQLSGPVDDAQLERIQSRELGELRLQALSRLPSAEPGSVTTRSRLAVQVSGTDQSLVMELPLDRVITAAELQRQFWAEFATRFGVRWERPLQLATLEVEVVVSETSNSAAPVDAFDGEIDSLGQGPQMIDIPNSTIWLEPGWSAERNTSGVIRLRRCESIGTIPVPHKKSVSEKLNSVSSMNAADIQIVPRLMANTERDPVSLELYCHRLTEIATQMGLMLQATCTSVNVKERLDFSCAVFDQDGNLLVNAPHIPVHLGAMSDTVKGILRRGGPFSATDVFVTNDPFQGGSHLPDVTVVTPVFAANLETSHFEFDADVPWRKPVFWVASRAHHAEIGGITPGSMPPFARCLEEEGVVLRNLNWTTATGELNPELAETLRNSRYPSRSPETNLADIQAQVAANALGRTRLQQFLFEWGWQRVSAYARHVQDSAAEHTLALLSRLTPGQFKFEDRLDCGLTIRLTATISTQGLTFDFSGTDPTCSNNFNTNPAIVQSAILYCLRVLIGAPIPLNQGVLRPIDIRIPSCFLNPLAENTSSSLRGVSDRDLPAVGGGNVETSQRIVDVVFGALQAAAASQGTMNNFLFGNAKFGFYETMGGGCGATPFGEGASAVHSHMTNTRLTDPEILEVRYPVRLLEFRRRPGSGGDGQHRGGDGMVRRFQFLEPVEVSLVTNRRSSLVAPPYGMAGGEPGLRGVNLWLRPGREPIELDSSCQLQVAAGDIVEIQTPGGGGWGQRSPNFADRET